MMYAWEGMKMRVGQIAAMKDEEGGVWLNEIVELLNVVPCGMRMIRKKEM